MQLFIRRHGLGLTILPITIIAVGCSDPNGEANKRVVEAQQLIEKAEKQTRPSDKLPTLREAEARLKSIVKDYPSANLAVQLASGQNLGTISLKEIADQIEKVEESACFETPSKACLIEQALRTGRSAKNGTMLQFACGAQLFDRVSFLVQAALAQKKAGLDDSSGATFDEALRASEDSKQSPDLRFAYLAPALVSAGRANEALQLLESVSDPKRRAFDLVSIARAQAAAGYKVEAATTFDQAVKLIPEETNDALRASTLLMLARFKIAIGRSSEATADIDQARRLIPASPTFININTLSNIADIQAGLGNEADANTALQQALDVSQGQQAKECYVFQIFNGKAALAGIVDIVRIADSLSNENMRSALLYYGAKGKADAGRVEEAQTIANAIKVDYFGALALVSISNAQTKAKLTSQAAQTLDMALRKIQLIQETGMRALSLLAIANAEPG